MNDIIIQIEAKHFCAGIVLRDGIVTRAAPIVAYMKGWSIERVKGYCKGRKWEANAVAITARTINKRLAHG